ncbi:MAG: hypothetical protein ACTH30_10155 [Leucobacter sp.]
MYYNPYTSQARELETHFAALEATVATHDEQLAWHRSFDAAAAAQRLTEVSAIEESYATQAEDADARMQAIRKQVTELENASKLGWNPTQWLFATERTEAKHHLKRQLAQFKSLKTQKDTYNAELDRARESIATTNESLQQHASFDIAAAEAEISELKAEIRSTTEEISSVKAQEAARLQLIGIPLKKLHSVEHEIRDLEDEVAKAERMDRDLSRAANGYERKLIHDRSQREFDDGTPRRVAERATQRIVAMRRDEEKLRRRVEELIERESQDVQSLVIDGSNLCYEGDRLIGLFAVRELCEKLPQDLSLTVVFDASILKKLGLPSEEALRAKMPGVAVHMVDDPAGADETILDAAENRTAYVISGDRFVDYPEKAVVQENRVLRSRIINKRVLISRLDINFEYSNETLTAISATEEASGCRAPATKQAGRLL